MTDRTRVAFPPLPVSRGIAAEDITDLGTVTLRGDIRSYAWDGGGDLSAGADPVATAGYFIDSSAGAAQFQEVFAFGGSFTNVTVEGDIKSANWDGADPANLATADATATLGYYLDSSVGSMQLEGDLFLGGDINFIAAAGILNFGDGFDLRVYRDNPAVGEDTLWIRNTEAQDGVDHVVIGPSAGSNYLKKVRVRADGFEVLGDGQLRFDINSIADGGDIVISDIGGVTLLEWDESQDTWDFGKPLTFDGIAAGAARLTVDFGEGYAAYADNTGSGTDLSRLWIDAPDQGEIILGPRAGANTLDRLRVRANEILFNWEDATGDTAAHTFPKGIVYDFGFDSDTALGAHTLYPSNFTNLAATATVPANISVTIFAWAWVRVSNTLDQEWIALDVTIGGTLPVNPALTELDLTTSSVDPGNTNTASVSHGAGLQVWDSGLASHEAGFHNTHFHTMPSHAHALTAQFQTIPYYAARSFTPTGSTVTIQARGGSQSGSSITYDDGALMYLVIVN